MDDSKVSVVIVKVGSVWAFLGITSLAEATTVLGIIAQVIAILYGLAMLALFCWKNWMRPIMEMFGWIQPKKRHWVAVSVDDSETGELGDLKWPKKQ